MKNSGVINIYKPEGLTSHDVVSKVRRKLGIKRVGHTGTLDPMATGVLPICFGKATRIIEYYDNDWKTYIAKMRLGIITDTLDITGEIIEERDSGNVTRQDILDLANYYSGEITQIPPKYSALKVNGKHLYEYAREGKEIDIEAKKRTIKIKEFQFTDIDIEAKEVSFRVICSKGTYIRSICAEIGDKLGCGATMLSLVRTRSGYFYIEDAINLDEFTQMDEVQVQNTIIDVDKTIVNLKKLLLFEGSEPFYFNGRIIDKQYYKKLQSPANEDYFADIYRLYDVKGNFLGTVRMSQDGKLKPEKVMGNRSNESVSIT